MDKESLINLLNEMTLSEKVAQMLQLPPSFYDESGEITGPMNELGITEETVDQVGSTLGMAGAKRLKNIQDEYLSKSRLKIPLLFMNDVIHGFRTGFPIPLAMGCSWNEELAEEFAKISAYESAVSGIHVTFSPMVDLVRDARWGRVMESTGEDPYLNARFAKAFVKGYQGDNLEKGRIASCVKHFAAYGASESGRDYNTVDMSRWMLREQYLPAYKAALDAGAKMIMTSFNTVEGVPATVNRWLMNDLLRKEWGFNGILISDWGALWESVVHGRCKDMKEAATLAIQATLDIEMCSGSYPQHLAHLVEEGIVDESELDQAVLRILELKNELGLFENPYRDADEELEEQVLLCAEHRASALRVAEESIVLLKNDKNTLPLRKEQKIALLGPKAVTGDLVGNWNCAVQMDEAVTIEAGIKAQFDHVEVCEAVTWDADFAIEKAVEIAKRSDVIILALGENWDMSGEAKSRAKIQLSLPQLRLIKAVKNLGKSIVALITTGRPLDLTAVAPHVDALLITWFLGTEAGNAIANTLIGKNNPSGKLSMSFPRSVGQMPLYYNHFKTGRPSNDQFEIYRSNYIDEKISPLYPFGYGLGYSSFKYSDVTLSSDIVTEDTPITASVMVSNEGSYDGKEVVQLYICDLFGRVVRPVKELKGFEKISLKAGESKEVSFTISESMLRFYDNNESFASEVGEFTLFIGTSSTDDTRKIYFSLR